MCAPPQPRRPSFFRLPLPVSAAAQRSDGPPSRITRPLLFPSLLRLPPPSTPHTPPTQPVWPPAHWSLDPPSAQPRACAAPLADARGRASWRPCPPAHPSPSAVNHPGSQADTGVGRRIARKKNATGARACMHCCCCCCSALLLPRPPPRTNPDPQPTALYMAALPPLNLHLGFWSIFFRALKRPTAGPQSPSPLATSTPPTPFVYLTSPSSAHCSLAQTRAAVANPVAHLLPLPARASSLAAAAAAPPSTASASLSLAHIYTHPHAPCRRDPRSPHA